MVEPHSFKISYREEDPRHVQWAIASLADVRPVESLVLDAGDRTIDTASGPLQVKTNVHCPGLNNVTHFHGWPILRTVGTASHSSMQSVRDVLIVPSIYCRGVGPRSDFGWIGFRFASEQLALTTDVLISSCRVHFFSAGKHQCLGIGRSSFRELCSLCDSILDESNDAL